MLLSTSLILLFTNHLIHCVPIIGNNHQQQCSSKPCQQAAQTIAQSLNRRIDPCDDFYEFACGGWIEQHPVPATKPTYSTAIKANDKMLDEIRYWLEDEPKTSTKNQSKIVQLTRFVYNQCRSLPNQANVSDEGLIGDLFKNWTFEYSNQGNNQTWWKVYLEAIESGLISQPGLFELEVIQNPKNQTEYLLSFDTVQYPVDNDVLLNYEKSGIFHSYKKYLLNISELIPNFPANERVIEQLLELEHRLVGLEMPVIDRRDPSKVINIMTFEQFQNETQGFDWLKNVINPLLSLYNVDYQATNSDRILVTDMKYFRNLTGLLEQISPEMFRNYFQIRAIQSLIPFLGERTRHVLYEFWKRKSGVRSTPDRWRTCFSQVQTMFSWALSRLYVDNYFRTMVDKNKALEIIDQVHEAFIQMIKMTKDGWMSDDVKLISLQKLNHIKKNVAFPEWLLDDERLDEHYNWAKVETKMESINDYLPLLTLFKWKQMQANLDKLNHNQLDDFDQNFWPLEPARINAAYSPEDNTITIPAGILRPPFFHVHWPVSLNYGGIGSVVGHELTHSLDDEGRHFDHEGNYRAPLSMNCIETETEPDEDSWWTEQMSEKFEQRSQCLVEQYSQIEEPVTKLPLNGTITLGENIADNGGLRQAFFALERTLSTGAVGQLADLPEFTSEQLFFLSNAQIWCSTIRPASLRAKIHNDLHVPSKYRVNVPASNMKQFARAFNCAQGTRMNPHDKCVLW